MQLHCRFLLAESCKIKQLAEVSYQQIAAAFNRNDLIIFTNPAIQNLFI